MQDVVIRIKGDSSDIVKLGEELKKLGKVDEDNAKQFKKNNEEQKKATKEQSGALKDLFKDFTDIKGQLMNIGKGILAAFAVEQVIEFGKESVKAFMEAELNAKKLNTAITTIGGEGSSAFKKLVDQSSELQKKGIFSDDAIQQAQTQLAQYGLMSNEIEALIPQIADMAAATGMDLGQATDTVIQGINGMTRGLKPLGLEFKDTGSKTENLRIVMEKLGKFSGQMDSIMETSAGKVKNWGNAWDDFKESVGAVLLGDFDLSGTKALNEQFDSQISSVINLKTNIEPLLNRYDELQTKSKKVGGETKLSKEEHTELKKIITEVSGILPEAITAQDKYGDALAISTQKARELILEEQAKLSFLNKQKIIETKEAIEDTKRRIALEQIKQNEIDKTHTFQIDILNKEKEIIGQRKATPEELIEFKSKWKQLQIDLEGAKKALEEFNGDYLAIEMERRKKSNEEAEKQRKLEEEAEKLEAERLKKKADANKAQIGEMEKLRKAVADANKEIENQAAVGKVSEQALNKYRKATNDLEKAQKDLEFSLASQADIVKVQTKDIKDIQIKGAEETAMELKQINLDRFKDQEQLDAEEADRRKERRTNDILLAAAGYEYLVGLGKQFTDQMKLQGKQAEGVQKAFALSDIAISTAKSIAALTASSTQVAAAIAAASGPAGIFTGPAAYAAYYGTNIATILANMLAAKNILGYEKGTEFLKRGGNPAGVDTIPVMANEGEAIIPTNRNAEKPGLAKAWIKGTLDDYININYVIPALKKTNKRDNFADNITKAIQMNAGFNDLNLLNSDKENRRILRSIDKTLKSHRSNLSRRKF